MHRTGNYECNLGPEIQSYLCVSPQLSFWQNRSISLVDMYTDQGEPSEKCGDLNFSLEYDYATQTLKLKIIQVSQTIGADAPAGVCLI